MIRTMACKPFAGLFCSVLLAVAGLCVPFACAYAADAEIQSISFEGNRAFETTALSDVITAKANSPSVFTRLRSFYYNALRKHPGAPAYVVQFLEKGVRESLLDRTFYDPEAAEFDELLIEELYSQNGYHEVVVEHRVLVDSVSGVGTLIYGISEGPQYALDTLVVEGLEKLEPELAALMNAEIPKVTSAFSESRISGRLDWMGAFLQNHGYYTATYAKPVVTLDSTLKTDSVFVRFTLGRRVRIGSVAFTEDRRGQPVVTRSLKELELAFKPGDWFSRERITTSRNNLLQIGTFDLVLIDTLPTMSSDTSTVDLRVFTQYRKSMELSASAGVNRTPFDNRMNAPVETQFLMRNLFGAAQSFAPFIRFQLQDLARLEVSKPLLGLSDLESEIQAGFLFSQPRLFAIDVSKWAFAFQGAYSRQNLSGAVRINRPYSIRSTVTGNFPTHTFINQVPIEVFIEASVPEITGSSDSITQDVLLQVAQINEIQNWYQTRSRLLPHTLALSISAISEKRDNLFAPNGGHFLQMALEMTPGPGLYSFIRAQLVAMKFSKITNSTVLAFRQRIGHSFWGAPSGNREVSMPFERHFFAGGANSIRAFAARKLRDPVSAGYDPGLDSAFSGGTSLTDVVGMATLVEGSLEFRYHFSRLKGLDELLNMHLERLGITAFLDWGMAFNRITDRWFGKANAGRILSPLNWAYGVGAGIRYDTPVGPFRLDFATRLFDPTAPERRFITQMSPLSNIQMHIGLGHAF